MGGSGLKMLLKRFWVNDVTLKDCLLVDATGSIVVEVGVEFWDDWFSSRRAK